MNKKQQPFFNPELSGFCSQMAMILHSGISPLEGITIMLEDSTSEQEKEILQRILDTLMETADQRMYAVKKEHHQQREQLALPESVCTT